MEKNARRNVRVPILSFSLSNLSYNSKSKRWLREDLLYKWRENFTQSLEKCFYWIFHSQHDDKMKILIEDTKYESWGQSLFDKGLKLFHLLRIHQEPELNIGKLAAELLVNFYLGESIYKNQQYGGIHWFIRIEILVPSLTILELEKGRSQVIPTSPY
jgi:hypothetical protein